METLLAVGILAFAAVLVVRGEISIRREDRRYAQAFPARIAHAQLEHRMNSRATALRDHLKPEDLEFLARNGSDFARSQLKAIEAPQPAPEPPKIKPKPLYYADADGIIRGRNSGKPVHPTAQASSIRGEHLKDRTQAERYYLR